MTTPLHELADIRTGHSFRGKISDTPAGNVRVVQIKDIKADTLLNEQKLPLIKWIILKRKPLQNDDILMPARGEYYNAALFKTKEINSTIPVVATNQLFIIRARSNEVLPKYLCWFLNQKTAKHYFKTHRSGTSIPMLNKDSLAALPVPVPPLDIQHKIVTMNDVWQQEKKITEQLLNNREQMLNGAIKHLLVSNY